MKFYNVLKEISNLLEDFLKVAQLAGVSLTPTSISFEVLSAPHKPPSNLPVGKAGVYVFAWKDQCLKVGKVGSKSKARFTSQHYNPGSSVSNLAKSVLRDFEKLGLTGINESNAGDWVKDNCHRINFFVDVSCGISVVTLLEVFLQCRLNPRYEGFLSQK
jgi:hypothetical protein